MNPLGRHVRLISRWYRVYRRDLPWRRTKDPYAIWVSETMLQQTQVTTVIPYYERFLAQFPSVKSLAESPLSKVLAAWSGLGYYSRARNFHQGAVYIIKHFDGEIPRTRDELLQVPGIGPYTAGAILSIAHNLPEAIVDGNVQRVFARFYGIKTDIRNRKNQDELWRLASQWVQKSSAPRILNQSLMELGALLCTKTDPRCADCPLRRGCVAHQLRLEASIPSKRATKKPRDLWWIKFVFERPNGQIFLTKVPQSRWWKGMWDLPGTEVDSERKIPARARKLLGLPITPLHPQIHSVTHHRIHVYPYRCVGRPKFLLPSGAWFSKDSLQRLEISSLVRKVLNG